ncbi:limonene-1,2-epoxide hydrolase family protein [Aquisediminimonas sediminicola]|uniref:limonene-1,2-epoxide hydrolase family protein n=1 Tax=Alteraquisediminimonas sediminicola TaxID=2676787 RepID=UPI001C8DA008|nr:limonene-1,2-epoxide hydrolase family protein [Aquisediminimonas sediminicola]
MTDQAISIVRDFIAAWNRKDRDAIIKLMHPDIICHGIPLDPAKGVVAAMALLDGFLVAEEIDWSLEHIAAQGTVVLTERVDRFRFKDADWTAVRAMGVFEIGTDGLIHLWRDYFDKEELLRALS